MLATIFTTIGDAASGLVTVLGDVLTAVTSWFWDPTLNSGDGGLTFIGILSVIALVGSITFFAIRFIRGLISMRRAM